MSRKFSEREEIEWFRNFCARYNFSVDIAHFVAMYNELAEYFGSSAMITLETATDLLSSTAKEKLHV